MTDFARFTQPIERKIVRKILGSIFSQPGRSVTVHDGEETTGLILREEQVYPHLASTGSDWLTVYDQGSRIGAIWLIWGNGEDLISDYTDTPFLHDLVELVDDIAFAD